MSGKQLGKLTRVDLRNEWSSEDGDFTPWLAREENLATLGETLGIELKLEAQEKSVGPFRADILCKDGESDAWVLIENQLEKTDHNHLGQLLTYASGLEAVTIIWIAARFTEEHRSTLDWLNRITDAGYHFFGLEVELWCIGDSPRAPKFNIVSKPNDWSRSVVRAARGKLSDSESRQLSYWTAFHQVLDEISGPVSGSRPPQARSWLSYPIGRGNFRLDAGTNTRHQYIRAILYISGEDAKAFFHLLQNQKQEIEGELGYPLEWEELPNNTDSKIFASLDNTDPKNEEDWARQHQWLAAKLNELHRVFANRVRELDAEEWNQEQGDSENSPSS